MKGDSDIYKELDLRIKKIKEIFETQGISTDVISQDTESIEREKRQLEESSVNIPFSEEVSETSISEQSEASSLETDERMLSVEIEPTDEEDIEDITEDDIEEIEPSEVLESSEEQEVETEAEVPLSATESELLLEKERDEEKETERETDVVQPEEISSLIAKLRNTRKKKVRLSIIDKLGPLVNYKEVRDTFIDLLRKDPSAIVRAKCASYLSDIPTTNEAKEALLSALKDPSPKVRHWVVWGLSTIISEEDVRDRLIHHLLYYENSKIVRYWIIRVLADMLSDESVEQVFLQLLRRNPDNKTKKLLIGYLSRKLSDNDVIYALSNLAMKEKNMEIKKQLFKILYHSNHSDAKYAIERIRRELKISSEWINEIEWEEVEESMKSLLEVKFPND